jgi:hypothetical protein
MLNTVIVLFGGFLVPLAAAWAGLLWIRPAVARARVEREALLIRDRVVDDMLAREIEPTNPRAQDAIAFCDFIANHSREITLASAFDTARGMRRAGVDPLAESKARAEKAKANSQGLATNEGQRCLEEAERDLDRIMTNYFVRGSALWWILAPAQRLLRFLAKRSKPASEQFAKAIKQPFPDELATDVREAARGATTPGILWVRPSDGSSGSRRRFAHA